MEDDTESTEAVRRYAEAYAKHYTARDLPVALQLYLKVIALHPDEKEAGYSRTQIQGIIDTVVPAQELLDAQVALAVAHFEHEASPDAKWTRAMPLASELST